MIRRDIHGSGSASGSLVPTLVPGIESSEVIPLVRDEGGQGYSCLHLQYPEAILINISTLHLFSLTI